MIERVKSLFLHWRQFVTKRRPIFYSRPSDLWTSKKNCEKRLRIMLLTSKVVVSGLSGSQTKCTTSAKSNFQFLCSLKKKCTLLVEFRDDSSPCKSIRVPAGLCESLRVLASPSESLRIPASPCESLRVPASPCESLRVPASHCESLRVSASPCESLQVSASPYESLPNPECLLIRNSFQIKWF